MFPRSKASSTKALNIVSGCHIRTVQVISSVPTHDAPVPINKDNKPLQPPATFYKDVCGCKHHQYYFK
eukprot:jgi/Botrbrau1/9547/Bobra.0089s0007.1